MTHKTYLDAIYVITYDCRLMSCEAYRSYTIPLKMYLWLALIKGNQDLSA